MKMMEIKNKLLGLGHGGFFHILTGNVLNRAITMLSAILVAKFVNKQEYAYLAYADNLYGYLKFAMGLGLSSALLKFCSNAQAKSVDRAYIKFSLEIGTTFEILASLALCILVSVIRIPFPQARQYCWLLLLYSSFSNLYTNIVVYFRTQLNNKQYALSGILYSAMTCVLTIVLLKMIGTGGIVLARYCAILLTILYTIPFMRRYLKGTVKLSLSFEQKKAFVFMGLSLMLANLFSGIMPLNESFLVNNIIQDEITTANFKVAGQFPQLLLMISGAVTVYFFPIVARLKDGTEIKRKVIQIGFYNFLLIAILAIAGILFTPLVFHLLYGSKYDDALSISTILWIMRATNCGLRMVPINMLPAIGKTKFNVIVAFISCVVQVALDYVFITHAGILGVAYGAIIVYGLSAVAYWIYFLVVCRRMEQRK